MTKTDTQEKLRKARIAFWTSLVVCALSMLIVFTVMEQGVRWKIITALLGFGGFLALTIASFRHMIQLQKKN